VVRSGELKAELIEFSR
jgi:hypothetical protein